LLMTEFWPEAAGGVNGAVTPKPGALAVLALVAHVSKLLSPVVAALIAPTIPPAVSCSGAEEPDGRGRLGDLESINTDCARLVVEWDEWRCETRLICSRVKLLSAWLSKRRLSHGVVSASELELDEITNVGGDLIGTENSSRRSIFSSTNDDGDICSESRDDGSQARESSGELHCSKKCMKN